MTITANGASVSTSSRFKSGSVAIASVGAWPNATRCKSHSMYAAASTIPSIARNTFAISICDVDTSTRNSPMKFPVPGNPNDATEKIERNTTNRGMALCKPP